MPILALGERLLTLLGRLGAPVTGRWLIFYLSFTLALFAYHAMLIFFNACQQHGTTPTRDAYSLA